MRSNRRDRAVVRTDAIGNGFTVTLVADATWGGAKLIETEIDFTGALDGATNLYLTFSDSERDWDLNGVRDAQDKLLPLLTIGPAGRWTQNATPPCGGTVSLISDTAQFATLTSADLRGWDCSVHEAFPGFLTDWTTLAIAIATDTSTKPTCGTDVDTRAAACGGVCPDRRYRHRRRSTEPQRHSAHGDQSRGHHPHRHREGHQSGRDTARRRGRLVRGHRGQRGRGQRLHPGRLRHRRARQVRFIYQGASTGEDTVSAAATVGGSRQAATAPSRWSPRPSSASR